MSGQRLLVVIIILAATAGLTTCQRWPNFQELFHRLKMYQSNPRGFRVKSVARLPSPAPQVSRRENSLQRRNDSAEMSYNQKKAALKDLLIKSAGTKQSNVAPLALGLLQKLKGRPLQTNKHFDKQASQIMSKPLQTNNFDKQASQIMSKPIQVDKHFDKQASLPNKIMSKPLHTNKHSDKQASMLAGKLMSKPLQADKHSNKPASLPAKKMSKPNKEKYKNSGRFSPPRSLDSGFTPFFLQSKAFDEKSYLESLTTTEPSTQPTARVTISVDKATEIFGEKKRKMKNTKQFINNYYKLPVFRRPPLVLGTVRDNDQEIVPLEDEMGFTKNWNFESERQNFYEPEKVLEVTRPIEVRTTTVPHVRKYSDNWDRTPSQNRIKVTRPIEVRTTTAPYMRKYSDNWDRTPSQDKMTETNEKYIKRKYDIRVPHRNQFSKSDISAPSNNIIPQMPQRKFSEVEFEERNDGGAGDVGFMESLPFSIPEELTFNQNDFNNFHWSKEELDPEKNFESIFDSKAMRNIERVDRHEIDGNNSRDKIQYYENEGQEEDINSFGDNFSFTESRMGTFYNDIEDTFPSIVNFGPSWESRRYR